MKIFFAGFVTGGNLWKEDKIRLLTGGILSKETINENIPCRRSSVEGGDKIGSMTKRQHSISRIFLKASTTPMQTRKDFFLITGIFYLIVVRLHLCSQINLM